MTDLIEEVNWARGKWVNYSSGMTSRDRGCFYAGGVFSGCFFTHEHDMVLSTTQSGRQVVGKCGG